jgi:hypothetical protein
MRNWIVSHPVIFAVVLALAFALGMDLLAISSRIRRGFRGIKNKWSERSVSRLRKRIEQLEAYRDRIDSYLNSDKALYLATLGIVITLIILLASGAGLVVLSDVLRDAEPTKIHPPFRLFGLLFYLIAIGAGFQGVKIAGLDSKEKISQMVAKLNSEIANLKAKLQAKLN